MTGSTKAGLYEEMLVGFNMDLIIWGNEHEQLMIPQPSSAGGTFDIIQPGSTVLTSLSAQECNPKQYGILEIRGTSYRLTPFALTSMRPVVRRTVQLRHDNPKGRTLEAVEEYLRGVVEDMVGEAEQQVQRIPEGVLEFHPNIIYPLMRLAVDFSDPDSAPFPQPNFNRFGQQYMDLIANAADLLKPIKPKNVRNPGTLAHTKNGKNAQDNSEFIYPVASHVTTSDIRAKVAEVFYYNAKDACVLLPEHEVSAAVYAFVEKGEKDAIDDRISELLNLTQKAVWREFDNGHSDSILKTDKIVDAVHRHKTERNKAFIQSAEVGVVGVEGDPSAENIETNRHTSIKNKTDIDTGNVLSDLDNANERKEKLPLNDSIFRSPTEANEITSLASRSAGVKMETKAAVDEELPGDGLKDHSVQHLLSDALKTISESEKIARASELKKRTRQEMERTNDIKNKNDIVDIDVDAMDDDDDDDAFFRKQVNSQIVHIDENGVSEGKKSARGGKKATKSDISRSKGNTRKKAPVSAAPTLNLTTNLNSNRNRVDDVNGNMERDKSPLSIISKWGASKK